MDEILEEGKEQRKRKKRERRLGVALQRSLRECPGQDRLPKREGKKKRRRDSPPLPIRTYREKREKERGGTLTRVFSPLRKRGEKGGKGRKS